MKFQLMRLIAVFLIPCLLLEPIAAAGVASSIARPGAHAASLDLFSAQAIPPAPVSIPATLHTRFPRLSKLLAGFLMPISLFGGGNPVRPLGDLLHGGPPAIQTNVEWLDWDSTPIEKRVLIVMSGGDCAGLNSLFGYEAQMLAAQGYAIAGVKNGLKGLQVKAEELRNNLIIVKDEQMARAMTDYPSFKPGSAREKLKEGEPKTETVLSNIEQTAHTIIVIGGNDHLKEGGKLARWLTNRKSPVVVVGAPKTIDGDTDVTKPVGIESAAQACRAMVRRAAAAPQSLKIVIAEVMGRDSGLLATLSGAGFEIFVPEFHVSIAEIRRRARERIRLTGALTIVTSEGFRVSEIDSDYARLLEDNPVLASRIKTMKRDAHNNLVIPQGMAAEFLAAILSSDPGLSELSPDQQSAFKGISVEILGFVPRGASVAPEEKKMARSFAKLLAGAIVRRQTGVAVGYPDDLRYLNKHRVLYFFKDLLRMDRARLFPFDELAGEEQSGASKAKNVTHVLTESQLRKAGVVMGENQPIQTRGPATLPETRAKDMNVVAGAVSATMASAGTHSRASVVEIAGVAADAAVQGLRAALSASTDKGVLQTQDLWGKTLIPLSDQTQMPLFEVLIQAYDVMGAYKTATLAVANGFKIRKDDPAIAALRRQMDLLVGLSPDDTLTDEMKALMKLLPIMKELFLILDAVESRSQDPEHYAFSGEMKELGQALKLLVMVAKPENRKNYLSNVRFTGLGRALDKETSNAQALVAGAA